MNTYYVYILKCCDQRYYVGVTSSLEERVRKHNSGKDPNAFTYWRRPAKLVHFEQFNQVECALQREKQLQGWSRRKKEALIAGDIQKLKQLARNAKMRAECASTPFGDPSDRSG